MSIRTAIVEDNINLLRMLVNNLSAHKEIEIVMIAANGIEALQKLQVTSDKLLPQLILMDIEMPEMDGITATAEITSRYKDIKIVMLTVFDQDDKIFDAILAGASGYLLKDETAESIITGIKEVMEGGAAMSSLIAYKALKLLRHGRPSTIKPEDAGLTKREIEILELFAEGLTNTQLAEKLFLSPATIRKHIENIYEKLQVHSKTEAVQLVKRRNWFSGFKKS